MRWPLSTVLLLAACSAGDAPGTIRVESGAARPVREAGGVGVAYFDVVNRTGSADRLLSVSSPLVESVETHETVQEGDLARMVPRPEGFVVPARGEVSLEPGGKHLMLYGVKRPLGLGDTIPLTLRFERAGAIEVQVPVRDPES